MDAAVVAVVAAEALRLAIALAEEAMDLAAVVAEA